ncbi:head GIN domain-containing protein [Aequorivita echinoideorum]|uniref:DUF2807 domain-containing protein n=1 Tax=Aequorivita echinoideorum TaxID=1549647 RepID=A0ABS5S0B7_9FLAO|nr:head GIN domain-containing protein [Aequorivita echinoideorum]MBT0606661.1 DUF2807 domain-containing protein [Aequorivita echinoideorum]
MKKLILIVSLIVLLGCDSEKGLNCFQTAGDIVQTEMTVATFSKIIVYERTKLFIQQGETQKVTVESGENLMNDIELKVENGVLSIYNNNGCNVVRDYGITKVYVTAPNITEIRSSTGLPIESIGVLRYPSLTLLSEDRMDEDVYHIDGDFILDLDVESLSIVANGLSVFRLKGSAEYASFGLFAGDCRIEAADLQVQSLSIFHRSTSEMFVNPQRAIRGSIVSLGNVISKNRPAVVEVEELYRGRLIFE